MKKIVVGFKTKEDVVKVLELYKEKGWRWHNGDEPLEFNEWKDYFKYAKENGGFYLRYKEKFGYGSVNSSEKDEEQIHFSTLLQ